MDINEHIVQLRGAGAGGLDQYETRLRNNAGHPGTLANRQNTNFIAELNRRG
jgi:hypothetical protein